METARKTNPVDRPRTELLLALTFVTGVIDAVTFLALGQVFSAMQTGNVIFLGFGIAGQGTASVGAPLVALAAFISGGSVAALVARRPGGGPGFAAAALAEASLLGVAALIAALADFSRGDAVAYVLIAILSLTMGLRNTTIRGVAGANVATTVLNLTLTAVTTHSLIALAPSSDLTQRGIALLLILAGAVTGALLLEWSLAAAIVLAGTVTLTVAVAHTRLAARPT